METKQVEKSNAERIARIIFEHAAVISREKDVSALVQLNADLARNLLEAERCTLWLVDENTGELWTKVAHGMPEIRIGAGEGIVGACIQANETILVNDVQSDRRFLRRIDESSGYQSETVLCVPLHSDGVVIGALQALNKNKGFTAADTEVLRLMAMYSASAIQAERLRHAAENTRLLQRELEIAAEVQRRLLPQTLLQSPGIEYAGMCRPAKSVGGDYYDFLELPGGEFGITLGDVAGKGFPAAVLMASIHTLLRHLLRHHPSNVAEVLSDLNDTVYQNSSSERYSTLFSGVFNAGRNELRYVNAGHIPPMIVRKQDGRIDRPSGNGLPLGLMPSISYEQHVANLGSGDLLVCMSDGILEAQDSIGDFYDSTTIENMLRDLRYEPVSEIASRVIRSVDHHAMHAEQFDDITIIIVRVNPL